MPDFCYIGPSRAGSTWLIGNLDRHPQVVFPQGKLSHYWDEHWRGGQVYGRPYKQIPVEKYLEDMQVRPGYRVGDITESYAPMPEENVRAFAEHCPDTDILMSLRNPMDIAWSACQLVAPRHIGALDKAPIDKIESYLKGEWGLCSSPHYEYYNCDLAGNLRKWRKHFGEERVMAYWFEDLVKRPRQLLIDISNHIGIDPDFWDTVPEKELKRVANRGKRQPPRQDVKEIIWRLHEPMVTDLEQYLDCDLSQWREKWRP
jgi:hypothetical protein